MIKTAIKRVMVNYEIAKKQKHIRKPVAYALYLAWKWADTYEKPRNITEEERK